MFSSTKMSNVVFFVLLCVSTANGKDIYGIPFFRHQNFKAIRASGLWGIIVLNPGLENKNPQIQEMVANEFQVALEDRLGQGNRGVQLITLTKEQEKSILDTLHPTKKTTYWFSKAVKDALVKSAKEMGYRRIFVVLEWTTDSKARYLGMSYNHQTGNWDNNSLNGFVGIQHFSFRGALLDKNGEIMFFGQANSSMEWVSGGRKGTSNDIKDCIVLGLDNFFQLMDETMLPQNIGKLSSKPF